MDKKKGRGKSLSKDGFLDAYAMVMRSLGVQFKKDGRTTSSRSDYWRLFTCTVSALAAAAASSGSSVSLAGVCSASFPVQGRSEETRRPRFKVKVSDAVQRVFDNDPSLVADSPVEGNDFLDAFCRCMAALDKPATAPAVEVLKAADNDPPPGQLAFADFTV